MDDDFQTPRTRLILQRSLPACCEEHARLLRDQADFQRTNALVALEFAAERSQATGESHVVIEDPSKIGLFYVIPRSKRYTVEGAEVRRMKDGPVSSS